MKITTPLSYALATLLVETANAHNPQVLSTAESRRLHQTRSLCSRDVHCILAHEATEGPYYIPSPLLRTNITEDRDGLPLHLNISVTDVTKCLPAKAVYVDIWHADAHGEYSGWAKGEALLARPDLAGIAPREISPSLLRARGFFSHGPEEDSRFLRGVALTDENGIAAFDTVMPAWYDGRTTHIHIRVHSGAVEIEDGALVGAGKVAHTGQLFFADELVTELAGHVEPYKTYAKTLTPMLNGDDGIFLHSEGEEQVVRIEREGEGGGALRGFVGVGIDPQADHQDDEGMPGGMEPPGAPRTVVGLLLAGLFLAAVGFVVGRWWRTRSTKRYAALATDDHANAENLSLSSEPRAAYRDDE
ncbi:Intradiol ring-cleavage dioxygenase [Delphinella strobiligena]|nr:Intradiol ring-cleavage dioxygenase [Delphinella strobiligena]